MIRTSFHLVCMIIAVFTTLFFSQQSHAGEAGKYWVYVGNSGSPVKAGDKVHGEIYICELNTETGKLKHLYNSPSIKSPGFLEIHPSGKFLYAVGTSLTKPNQGVMAAYSIDKKTGKLTFINEQTCGGSGPCHVNIDKSGKFAMLANYGSGGAELIPINPDGSLAEPSSYVQHSGTGADPKRQKGPHAHSCNMDPTDNYCLVADLGIDKVMFHKLDREKNKLVPAGETILPPGSGPRHLAFHPIGKYFFVNNEMLSTVSVVSYQAEPLKTEVLQTISTLPADWNKPGNSTAETRVSPDGNYVYVSNRGHDSIAVYSFDSKGSLKLLHHVSSQGEVPRNFNLTPHGKFMVVGNQKTGNAVLFTVNEDKLEVVKDSPELKFAGPICFRFLTKDE